MDLTNLSERRLIEAHLEAWYGGTSMPPMLSGHRNGCAPGHRRIGPVTRSSTSRSWRRRPRSSNAFLAALHDQMRCCLRECP